VKEIHDYFKNQVDRYNYTAWNGPGWYAVELSREYHHGDYDTTSTLCPIDTLFDVIQKEHVTLDRLKHQLVRLREP
jgi:hypothetical protein